VAAAEDVEVEMIDALAAVGAGVDDDTIPIGQALFARNIGGGGEKVAEQGGVTAADACERCDVLARDHEKMGRRLRVNVSERDALFVLVNGLGGNGSSDDLAKKAIHIGNSVQERVLREDNFAIS
jgi:hypothetical protein